ncbi:MAG: hypothetical protein GX288_08075 [Clostridiales bacterium]|mgnify:CR=1 FL=1|nr:hypothetical protein [Clostridiales bacterium]
MKRLKLHINQLNNAYLALLILIIGLFIGVLFANIFRTSYSQQLFLYKERVLVQIIGEEIDYSGLFSYILRKNIKEFLVFWLLSITILGIPYIIYKIVSFGFLTGFFLSVLSMEYGTKGILLVLAYIFPHGLVYLPLALLCLYKGYDLCSTVYRERRYSMGSIKPIIKQYLMIILILFIALIIGSFLEAYLGSSLLKKALSHFL